ncbi:MAG: tRNA (guanosine(37)-N1)-methyltransferase TrmD [candidate division WOR-3 bacterium]|nr:tRNA (guanosine(37)-N1)-methyltransferase TrmD [candidate division WOR-3 bacterium]
MKFDIVSIFPEFFEGPLSSGMMRVAREKGIISVNTVNPRNMTADGVVDDYQFGGGAGMVFKPEPLIRTIESIMTKESKMINLTPKGSRLTQKMVSELAGFEHLILICGRYKGVDERINDIFEPIQISIGDYILSGGEIAALAIVESVTRLLPGVLGNQDSADSDSFHDDLLEAPIYTRPHVFRKCKVPEVLRGGNHKQIAEWRRKKSLESTLERRPELLANSVFSKKDFQILLEVLYG